MPYATLTLQSDGETAIITLNRPEKRNAISTEMIEELLAALDQAETGPARVVIPFVTSPYTTAGELGDGNDLTLYEVANVAGATLRLAKAPPANLLLTW